LDASPLVFNNHALEHIFHGEHRPNGNRVGMHYVPTQGSEHVRIMPGTQTPPNAHGVTQVPDAVCIWTCACVTPLEISLDELKQAVNQWRAFITAQ
jgi:hypothetical protein